LKDGEAKTSGHVFSFWSIFVPGECSLLHFWYFTKPNRNLKPFLTNFINWI